MSITRSYNKHTDTYYAYDTTYVWDEAAQKKIQKKRCIGKFDPETNEIIQNGKRGRPLKAKNTTDAGTYELQGPITEHIGPSLKPQLADLHKRLELLEKSLMDTHAEVASIQHGLSQILQDRGPES